MARSTSTPTWFDISAAFQFAASAHSDLTVGSSLDERPSQQLWGVDTGRWDPPLRPKSSTPLLGYDGVVDTAAAGGPLFVTHDHLAYQSLNCLEPLAGDHSSWHVEDWKWDHLNFTAEPVAAADAASGTGCGSIKRARVQHTSETSALACQAGDLDFWPCQSFGASGACQTQLFADDLSADILPSVGEPFCSFAGLASSSEHTVAG